MITICPGTSQQCASSAPCADTRQCQRIPVIAPGEARVYDLAQAARRVGMRLVHSPVHGLQQVPYLRPEHVEVGVAA